MNNMAFNKKANLWCVLNSSIKPHSMLTYTHFVFLENNKSHVSATLNISLYTRNVIEDGKKIKNKCTHKIERPTNYERKRSSVTNSLIQL